jgi:hypothetical protein
MFYVWLHWNIWTQPTKDDPDQTYIINDYTKEVLKTGDPEANGIGMAIVLEVIYDERFGTKKI